MHQIWPIEVFADNYVWVIERDGSDRVAIVDPGDGAPVVERLDQRGLEVAAVLLTHHHHDHVGGLAEVIDRFHPAVYGSRADAVPGVDRPLDGGETIELADLDLTLEVLALPGHTANHLGYLGAGAVFVGDTLFAGGCGKLLGGTAEQMHASLAVLASLPAETMAYCAHEYTVANLRFASRVEPGNQRIAERLEAAVTAREAGHPTVPSTIGYELETNVFLRSSTQSVVSAAAAHADSDLEPGVAVFAAVRAWKDGWTG